MELLSVILRLYKTNWKYYLKIDLEFLVIKKLILRKKLDYFYNWIDTLSRYFISSSGRCWIKYFSNRFFQYLLF